MFDNSSRFLARRGVSLAAGLLTAALWTNVGLAGGSADKLVIQAGHLVPKPGEMIENGVVVVEGGRIVAIGKQGEVEVPWDAPVIGGKDHWVVPGFVESYTSRGMDRPNENLDVAPFLDVRDSIDPINVDYEDYLRWGVTTINVQQGPNCVIGARGRVIKPVGMTVEDMTVRPLYGLVLSASPKAGKSRATQAQTLRDAFDDLKRYLEVIVADAKAGGDMARREALYQGRDLEGEAAKGRAMGGSAWKVEGLELIPRGAIDEKQEPLLQLIEGRYKAFIHCSAPNDVSLALEVAKQNGFLDRTVLVLSGTCYKAAKLIADAKVPAILQGGLSYTERDPVTGDETEILLPKVYRDAGVRFAISSANTTTASLWFQASRAIALGLEPAQAFAAVGQTAAELLGIDQDLGTLEKGKLGNLVLLTGDPMEPTTWVDHVVIEGVHVYDRSKDTRNKYVIEGITPIGAAPLEPGAAAPTPASR
jgi:imidazolonepropionase-like amidohydrolase